MPGPSSNPTYCACLNEADSYQHRLGSWFPTHAAKRLRHGWGTRHRILSWLLAAPIRLRSGQALKPCPCYKASFGFVVSHPCREETAAWMGHPASHFIVAACGPHSTSLRAGFKAVPLLQGVVWVRGFPPMPRRDCGMAGAPGIAFYCGCLRPPFDFAQGRL